LATISNHQFMACFTPTPTVLSPPLSMQLTSLSRERASRHSTAGSQRKAQPLRVGWALCQLQQHMWQWQSVLEHMTWCEASRVGAELTASFSNLLSTSAMHCQARVQRLGGACVSGEGCGKPFWGWLSSPCCL